MFVVQTFPKNKNEICMNQLTMENTWKTIVFQGP